jgi:hypothetical protein
MKNTLKSLKRNRINALILISETSRNFANALLEELNGSSDNIFDAEQANIDAMEAELDAIGELLDFEEANHKENKL